MSDPLARVTKFVFFVETRESLTLNAFMTSL